MPAVQDTTKSISWFFRPISYKPSQGEKVTEQSVQKWHLEAKDRPNIIQRSSPATLGGIIALALGTIGTIFGFAKDNKIAKWIFGALGLIGAGASALGLFKNIDLTVKPPTKEEKLLNEIRNIMHKGIEENARRLNLNPEKLKAMLPEVITLDELIKLYFNQPEVKELIRKVYKRNPFWINPLLLKNMPKDLIDELFPEGPPQISDVKENLIIGGGLNGKIYKVGISPDTIEDKKLTSEEAGLHEGNHVFEIILRSLLPKNKLVNAVKEELIEEIKNGTGYVAFGPEGPYIPPVISSDTLRNQIACFTQSLFDNLGNDDPRLHRVSDPDVLKDLNIDSKRYKLTNEGQRQLRECLYLNKHKEFLELYENDENKALEAIGDYIETQIHRLNFVLGDNGLKFSPGFTITIPPKIFSTLPHTDLKLSKEAEEFAIKSAKEFIRTQDGNILVQSSMHNILQLSPENIITYAFAPEEIRSNLAYIETQLKDTNLSQEERSELEAKKELYNLGPRLIELRRQLSISLQDPKEAKKVKEYKETTNNGAALRAKILYGFSSLEKAIEKLPDNVAKNEMKLFFKDRVAKIESLGKEMISLLTGGNASIEGIIKTGIEINDFSKVVIKEALKKYKDQIPELTAIGELLDENDSLLKQVLKLANGKSSKELGSSNQSAKTTENKRLLQELEEVEAAILTTLKKIKSKIMLKPEMFTNIPFSRN